MKKLLNILTVLIVLTIYSCGTEEKRNRTSADLATQEPQSQTDEQKPDKLESIDKKIIKQGELSFETSDINKTKSFITQTVQELNGYFSKDDAYYYSDKQEHRLIIRVPSDKFDLLLKKISESTMKLDSKNIEMLDVTKEYIDIEARIKTQKELQNRYKELLKQATKADEILNIEKEIGELQTEIERVEGQMKYLKDKISFSTLTVTYYQKVSIAFRFTSKFVQALKDGWSGFLWFLIGLTHLWTYIIIALVIIYLIIRHQRKKKKKVV